MQPSNKNLKQLDKADEKWLRSTQRQLQKLINSPYWDMISLSNMQLDIITHIMNAKNCKQLSPVINERITEEIIKSLKIKLKRAKENCKEK